LELLPPQYVSSKITRPLKVALILIFIILIIKFGLRMYDDMGDYIIKIDSEIKREAQNFLQKFSQLNCDFDKMGFAE
jgi:hypothetical protein